VASLKKMMMSHAPLSYGAMAEYPASADLRKKFSTHSRFGDDILLFEETKNGTLLVPRGVCPIGANDNRTKGVPMAFHMETTPKDKEQARVYGECLELLQAGHSHIVQAGTGSGKTWVGLAIASALGVCTLVIVPKDDLVTQWTKRILEHTDVKANEIGRIQQDKCDVYNKKVVIASLKSLSIPDRYPVAIRKLFGLVIFDEVHRLGADTFQVCCKMFPAFWRLGLSATPERKDGKEIVFLANIGPVRVISEGVPMIPKVMRYESGWKCPRIRKVDKITGEVTLKKMPHAPGKAGRVVRYLLRDQERNKLLVWLMIRAYKNDRNTVIFSAQIDHLELLRDIAVKNGIPRSAFGEYYGGARSEKHLDEAAAKPLVLATPGKAGDGTDFPWWDCCILAAPMASIKQTAGRVLREYPGKRQPVIMDIDDSDSHVFKSYMSSRDDYYASVGAKTKEMQHAVAASA
jgi:superfamily II DNA or RNA helicase